MNKTNYMESISLPLDPDRASPLLRQRWGEERAFRIGHTVARITFIITSILTVLNIIYSGVWNVLADLVILGFCGLSLYLTHRQGPKRHFVWWPLYIGFLIGIIPSLWLSGGVYSPWMAIYIAVAIVLTAVVQTKIKPLHNMILLFVYVMVWLAASYIFPFEGSQSYVFNLPPHFMAIGVILMNFGIAYGIYELLKTEKDLSAEIERQYAELFETKANLLQEESANQSKSDFLANISHELRTPLGSILGYAHLLQSSRASDAEKLMFARTIERSGQQLAHLVDDLLDLSKVEAGKIELEKFECNIPDLISDVLNLLQISAKKKAIDMQVQFVSEIPETAHTDPYRFKQILTNIIGNALKFTEEGAIQLKVNFLKSSSEFILSVKDTGRGIAVSERDKLFKPFSQADASTARRYGGTGLGLNFSRQLARLLNGDLELTWSELGKGSEFTLRLPLEVKPHTKMVSDLLNERVSPQPVVPAVEQFSLGGVRILVVDDARENRDIVKRFLMPSGAYVDEAGDGFECLQKVETSYYDIILMDIQMPGMDGLQATAMLRQRLYNGAIVAISAHAMSSDKSRSIQAGCDDHLAKPLKKSELIETIRRYRPNERPQQAEAEVLQSLI